LTWIIGIIWVIGNIALFSGSFEVLPLLSILALIGDIFVIVYIIKGISARSSQAPAPSPTRTNQTQTLRRETSTTYPNTKTLTTANEDNSKLVVVNGCEDLVVVNTKDATYISKKGESKGIRQIISNHYDEEKDIFDEGDIFYTAWGIKETLTRTEGYTVRKLTIFPGKEISMHKHEMRSEHWSIVSGIATVSLNGETKDYASNSSVYVPVETFHRIANEHAKDLVIIEVGVGTSAGSKTGDLVHAQDDFVKLKGSYKDYLWGGTKLFDIYHKENLASSDRIIAESWELSAHSAGPSTIAEGYYKGMDFNKYLNKIGKQALGWKCQPFDEFPLLVKFIDATKSLSVQVHPDDEYAMRIEGEYGKNEMWYILDAEENAFLYVGLIKTFHQKSVKSALQKEL